jgi:hypothetical protein
MIEDFNPWWTSREGVEEVEIYRRYAESEVRWRPDLIDKLSLRPFSLNFVFGPRQVGKSTALILLVKELLERGVHPKSIFYLSCDAIADYRELAEVLRMYLKVRRAEGISSSYILLDEVTYPREWFRAVKSMIDMGYFRNDVLVLSGSLSISARREAETFAGRRATAGTWSCCLCPSAGSRSSSGLGFPGAGWSMCSAATCVFCSTSRASSTSSRRTSPWGASPTPCGSTSNTAESPAWLGRRPGDKPRCRCAGDPGREPPRIRISAKLP